MRTAVSALEVLRPKSLSEAVGMLRTAARAGEPLTPVAGGTDLFVYLNAGTLPDRRFLDVWPLRELRGIEAVSGGLRLGAGETMTHLRESGAVRRLFPALAAAAGVVGGWQIQNRATLAGNVANGSPAGDTLPALLALDARVALTGPGGGREVAFGEFYTGYRATVREPDELITSLFLPRPPAGARQHFRKIGTRAAQAISKVVLATVFQKSGGRIRHARIALGSVAPTVIRARVAEELLLGEKPTPAVVAAAVERARSEIAPIDDIRSDARYRRDVAGRILELALAEV